MEKLNVFIGSSSEERKIDTQIRNIIEENNAKATNWRKIFTPGEFGLDSLIKISNKIDAAVLIASLDDKIWYRGNKTTTPRDNIIFEIGLFIRALGRNRVAVVVVNNENGETPKLPSDLLGLNLLFHDINKPAKIEHSISNWICNLVKISQTKNQIYSDTLKQIDDNLNSLPLNWSNEINNFILNPVLQAAEKANKEGRVHLSKGQYYDHLNSEMRNANSKFIIRAFADLDVKIWTEDEDQKAYLEANIEAAKKGAVIKRLFTILEKDIPKLHNLINHLIENKIEARIIKKELFLKKEPKLRDSVIIKEDQKIRSYLSNRDIDSSGLKGGELLLHTSECKTQIEEFDKFWELSNLTSIKKKTKNINIIEQQQNPPGKFMESKKLDTPVISCEQAALFRNVPLKNELKTLILYSSRHGLIAVHIPGNEILSLRKVKDVLDSKDVCLADPEELHSIGITAGTACAILNPVWSLPHLVSRRLLSLDYVTTNNGTKTGYYKFEPWKLLKAKSALDGDFEK